MGPTRDYEAALRSELLKAAHRRRIHRHRHRIAVGALAAIALLVGVGLVSRDDSSRPVTTADTTSTTAAPTTVGPGNVDVRRSGGRVVVTLLDRGNTAEQVDAAVREAGLDIRVQAKPAGPSKVGLFVGYTESGGTVDADFVEGDRTAFDRFSLPADWPGRLVLHLGREAKPAETYLAASDAYAEGEPLVCTKTLGQPLSRLEPSVKGYSVRVFTYADGQPDAQLTYAEALDRGLGDETVTKASALSATELVVDVAGPTVADPPFRC